MLYFIDYSQTENGKSMSCYNDSLAYIGHDTREGLTN